MRRGLWDQMRQLQEQMESMFSENRLLSGPENYRRAICDVYETEDNVVAEVELPGIDKDNIDVDVDEDGIEVKAEMSTETESDDTYQRSYSGFYRRFPLPSGTDPDSADAEYKNGMLTVKVPKTEKSKKKGRRLDVR
ncbi:MAG: Hsp20/alpha crystallin family protein [Nanoarchaeota archaeon]